MSSSFLSLGRQLSSCLIVKSLIAIDCQLLSQLVFNSAQLVVNSHIKFVVNSLITIGCQLISQLVVNSLITFGRQLSSQLVVDKRQLVVNSYHNWLSNCISIGFQLITSVGNRLDFHHNQSSV